jgi:hypothetical protein
MSTSSAVRLKEMYISAWLRVPGVDYENQAVATKLFYFAYGNTTMYNDGGLTLRGSGEQAVVSSMTLRAFVSPDATSGSVNYYHNTGSTKTFTVGDWHHVEMLVKTGTPDRADGSLHVWLDDELVMAHPNVKFLDSGDGFTQGFFQAEWAPVWGGVGGTRTRDDYIQVDNFYVSGLAQ